MKAYIVGGRDYGAGDRGYDLVREDGKHVASHVCSDPSFAPGDLWTRRTQRREENPEIDEVVWIEDDPAITLDELVARNRAYAEGVET